MENEKKLNIELSNEVAQGCYSNLAIVTHSSNEFIVDFVRVLPGMPKAQVGSRIIMTPANLKRLVNALQDNVNKFKIKEEHLPYHTHPHTHTAYGGTYSDSFYDDYATSAGSAQSGSGASLMTNSGSTDSISITIPDKETSREIEEIKHWSNDPITIEPKGYKLIFIMKVSNWYNKI